MCAGNGPMQSTANQALYGGQQQAYQPPGQGMGNNPNAMGSPPLQSSQAMGYPPAQDYGQGYQPSPQVGFQPPPTGFMQTPQMGPGDPYEKPAQTGLLGPPLRNPYAGSVYMPRQGQ